MVASALTGTRPITLVPVPGDDWTSSVPPIASNRSAIPWSPVPCPRAPTSKHAPSSRTSNVRWPSCFASWTSAELASATC